ncbi:hypothetical protein FSHL1_006916 [Fusarium sambucinum]
MSATMDGLDIERQGNLDETTSLPAPKALPDFQERAGQGCFICLQSHRKGQYTVLVPCMRPTKHREMRMRIENSGTGESRTIYKENSPWDSARESDYEIYQRLLDTCYQHLGRWKKWLPYYGITEVLEVNFQFDGVVEANGRYPIYMEPVNVGEILEECKTTIARHPTGPYFYSNEACIDGIYGIEHSDECIIGMQEFSQPCIRSAADEAEKRLRKLRFLSHLKDCARNPKKADGLNTLEGMAQESCIYHIKYVCHTNSISLLYSYPRKHTKPNLFRGPKRVAVPIEGERFQCTTWTRGLHFVLGWQTDRIRAELPFRASCASLAVALIWLCLVVWRGAGGDWGTAFAFAQVVAASFAITITYARL